MSKYTVTVYYNGAEDPEAEKETYVCESITHDIDTILVLVHSEVPLSMTTLNFATVASYAIEEVK